MTVNDLPTLNASLNATSAVLLATGYLFIRSGQRARHRLCMLAALVTSAMFLTSYVIYHAQVGSKPFPGTGPIRTVYFVILITHVILADRDRADGADDGVEGALGRSSTATRRSRG